MLEKQENIFEFDIQHLFKIVNKYLLKTKKAEANKINKITIKVLKITRKKMTLCL